MRLKCAENAGGRLGERGLKALKICRSGVRRARGRLMEATVMYGYGVGEGAKGGIVIEL